jgi:hypothetical protein
MLVWVLLVEMIVFVPVELLVLGVAVDGRAPVELEKVWYYLQWEELATADLELQLVK